MEITNEVIVAFVSALLKLKEDPRFAGEFGKRDDVDYLRSLSEDREFWLIRQKYLLSRSNDGDEHPPICYSIDQSRVFTMTEKEYTQWAKSRKSGESWKSFLRKLLRKRRKMERKKGVVSYVCCKNCMKRKEFNDER